jgi:hypothetical protein
MTTCDLNLTLQRPARRHLRISKEVEQWRTLRVLEDGSQIVAIVDDTRTGVTRPGFEREIFALLERGWRPFAGGPRDVPMGGRPQAKGARQPAPERFATDHAWPIREQSRDDTRSSEDITGYRRDVAKVRSR